VRRSDSALQTGQPLLLGTLIRRHFLQPIAPFDGGRRPETNRSFNGPDPPTEKFSRGVQSGKNGIFRGFRPPAPKRPEVTSCRFGQKVRLAVPRDRAKNRLDIRCGKNVTAV
jgi:hypothetical protein